MTDPTPGELEKLFASLHGRPFIHDLPTAPAQQPVNDATASPAKPRRMMRLLLAIAVLTALTVFSVHQIRTGIAETPRAAPLPAATFTSVPTGAAPAAAGIAGTNAAQAAPSGRTPDVPGVATHPAVAAGADPRPQTPTGPLSADELLIPALSVRADVSDQDLTSAAGQPCKIASTARCSLLIPGDVRQVGEWTGSAPLIATAGSVLLAGHIDNIDQGPGALHDLYLSQPGDLVYLTRHGQASRWKIVALQIFSKDTPHPDWFAGNTGGRTLHLVTCGGPLLTEADGTHTYADNVAVTAVPA